MQEKLASDTTSERFELFNNFRQKSGIILYKRSWCSFRTCCTIKSSQETPPSNTHVNDDWRVEE